MNEKRDTRGDVFRLLIKGNTAREIVDDWYEGNQKCDIRLRRAKTPGCVVIETTDTLFAHRILRHYPTCRVSIKEGCR